MTAAVDTWSCETVQGSLVGLLRGERLHDEGAPTAVRARKSGK